MEIINVCNLSAYYENKKVFENLSFFVNKGEYLCITGDNGSGKTTLMNCILGLSIKHKGKISFSKISKNDIGWLPQKTEYQNDFPASVLEVVMSGFYAKSRLSIFKKSEYKKEALEKLRFFGIENLSERSFRELSGGQQQKVFLCRALCGASDVLLLDEPVTGLDQTSKQEMYDLIKKLNDSGITIIMITHEINEALKRADKILCMTTNGYFFGTPSEHQQEHKGE